MPGFDLQFASLGRVRVFVIPRRGWLTAMGGMLVATPAWTQTVPVRTLPEPEASFAHGFTRVAGVRELSDGRVIVLDVNDRTVQVIDSAWNTMTQIGRHGSGPGEYIAPYALFPLPGDSTAVPDRQNMRMLVITPDTKPGGFLNPAGAAGRGRKRYPSERVGAGGLGLLPASTSDGHGYYYTRAQPIVVSSTGKLELADSMAIERWSAMSAKRDTAGFVPYTLPPNSQILKGMFFYQPTDFRAFQAHDQWAVAPDGRLAIVHVEPYRVDFVTPSGERRNGPLIAYDPVRMTEAHKRQWREEQRQSRPTIVVTPDGRSGTVNTTSPPREPKWPKYLPPFVRYPAAHFASDGMLWVERTTPVGEPHTFDIIDGTGRVIEQLKLPVKRRLVGFGRGTVYLVRVNEVDLEFLERYRLGR
ncbi:MAG: hypothetical protein ACE5HT_16595 [Gemmatimonadales bacterium]